MTLPLKHSRWFRLLPVVFVTYSLAFLDRANFGFGTAGGMTEDLHVTKGMSSLLGALFFLGYFFFQIPGTIYASNKSARKLIFWSLILWGAMASATGLVSNTPVLAVIRFMLGVVESAVFPSMLVLLSRWFTSAERSRANTFMILGNPATILWMSIVSGYLVDAVGWRGMFVVEGLPAMVWAFFWFRLVTDKPSDASWLEADERKQLGDALAREQAGIKPVKDYLAAFRSGNVMLLSAIYIGWSVGIYGFVMWLPSIIKAAPGISMVMTGWLSAVPYVFAIGAMLASSYFSDRTAKRTVFIWPFLLIGSLAFYGSYALGSSDFWLSFGLLCLAAAAMYAPYGPFFALITEILPRNVAGGAIALVNSFGALGSFAGSYLVGYLNGETHSFNASYIFLSVSLLVAALITLTVRNIQSDKLVIV